MRINKPALIEKLSKERSRSAYYAHLWYLREEAFLEQKSCFEENEKILKQNFDGKWAAYAQGKLCAIGESYEQVLRLAKDFLAKHNISGASIFIGHIGFHFFEEAQQQIRDPDLLGSDVQDTTRFRRRNSF